jgi:FkbM family methyltransferase
VILIQNIIKKIQRFLFHIRNGTLFVTLRNRTEQFKREKKWQACKKNSQVFHDRIFSTCKINLYPNDRLSEFIFKREFECTEQEFIRKYLGIGDIFVDIGANIGLFTILAANEVGQKGKVIAFEPTLETYNQLLTNIAINYFNNVKCIHMALSNKEGIRTLIKSIDGFGAWNSLAKPTAGKKFDIEEVRCTTWDIFSEENDLTGKVNLIKIDIEGWELYALEGAEKTFKRDDAPDLLIEFTEVNARSAGTSCADIYNKLTELGYQIFSIDTAKGVLFEEKIFKSYPHINLLSTKKIDSVCERVGFSIVSS